MRCNIIREPSRGGIQSGTVVGESYMDGSNSTCSKINIPITQGTKVVYFTQKDVTFRRAMVIKGQTGAMIYTGSVSTYGVSLEWGDDILCVKQAPGSTMNATWLYAAFE